MKNGNITLLNGKIILKSLLNQNFELNSIKNGYVTFYKIQI